MKPVAASTYKILAHTAVPDFNYSDAVDWAVEMMMLGHETENLLILSSLTKPVNYFETVRYLNAAISELGLSLALGKDGIISYSRYYIIQIAKGLNMKQNLEKICKFAIDIDYESSIYDFCKLSWAWGDLEWPDNNGMQWYWEGATKDNIEQISIDTAKQWLTNNKSHINNRPVP